ncbi:AT-rich interactive domain-containing protein 2 [Linum perenne]
MGYKRIFEDTDFQGFPLNPLKQARQQDLSNRSTQFEENMSDITSPKIPDSAVGHCDKNGKQLCHEASENAVVPRNCIDEDISFRLAAYSSLFPETYEYKGLQEYTALNHVGIHYVDRFPRKQVALGRNHQASIPSLCTNAEKHSEVAGSSEPKPGNLDNEEKLMGTCIIPMPDTESVAIKSDQLLVSGPDCQCLDADSLRCVRQHIAEARDKLKKSLGHEKFVSLGFHNMGEEVSWKWSEDEERLFRAVIYSNPVSLGQNFWKHLAQVFPSRSTKEIVSYYFNVFMLRKRATQNRSSLLDIDSDDDQLHGIDISTYEGEDSEDDEDDDDSGIESPVEHYGQSNRGEDIVTDDDDDDDDDGNGGMGNGYRDVTEQDSKVNYFSETTASQKNEHTENYEEDNTIQDESCTSFEFQADKDDDPYYLMNREENYMMDVGPMLDFHNDEVLYKLYSTPEKAREPVVARAENGEAVKKGGRNSSSSSDAAVDLVSMLDFRDEKAWDSMFPGSA